MRWALLVLAAACAAQEPRGPYFGDERHLVLGVDPERETAAIVASMEQEGHALALRLRGIHFTALDFVDVEGKPVAVRIVTARGIALALDAQHGDALRPARAWRLLPVRLPRVLGVEADEQVFVEERITGVAPCVRAYEVDAAGNAVAAKGALDPRVGSACDGADVPADAGVPEADRGASPVR